MFLDKERIEFLKKVGVPKLVAEMSGASVKTVYALRFLQIQVGSPKTLKIIEALDKLMQLTKETQQQNEQESDNPGHPAIELPPQ